MLCSEINVFIGAYIAKFNITWTIKIKHSCRVQGYTFYRFLSAINIKFHDKYFIGAYIFTRLSKIFNFKRGIGINKLTYNSTCS